MNETRTIDTDQTAQDIRSLIGNVSSAQNALHPCHNGHPITKAEMAEQVAFAVQDLHRLRGNIRTMAQRMGVEY